MPFSITTEDLPRLFVMLALASVLGYISVAIAGGRVPLGAFGSIAFALLGAWVMTDLLRPRIPFTLPSEPQMDGVMLITAGLGAFLFSLVWCLIAARFARRRRRL
jgi:uncharacterized membrane protein YeaQ/YmgE (transglycosylase-associated protein family)